jgi:hypothetical protein
MSLHLSTREIRALHAGRVPRRVREECRIALVWIDEGYAAGMRDMQRAQPPHNGKRARTP